MVIIIQAEKLIVNRREVTVAEESVFQMQQWLDKVGICFYIRKYKTKVWFIKCNKYEPLFHTCLI